MAKFNNKGVFGSLYSKVNSPPYWHAALYLTTHHYHYNSPDMNINRSLAGCVTDSKSSQISLSKEEIIKKSDIYKSHNKTVFQYKGACASLSNLAFLLTGKRHLSL